MKESCICWVVALSPEAKPLIEEFEMVPVAEEMLHPIYSNKDCTSWLVITGVGQLNAASGTASLYQACPRARSAVWVNIGIAGGSIAEVGHLLYVNTIWNHTKNKAFYPYILPNTNIKQVGLVTCNCPQIDYSKDHIFDMEAWAFYKIINKKVPREFIAVLKVISDSSEDDLKLLKKEDISLLLQNKILKIRHFAQKARLLSEQEFERLQEPEIFNQLLAKFHFTFTQQQELRSLTKRWQVFYQYRDLSLELENKKYAKDVLTYMRSNLDAVVIDWEKY